MLTREKNGIQKPRVLCASNYPLPQSFVVLPPTSVPCEPSTFTTASQDSHWVSIIID